MDELLGMNSFEGLIREKSTNELLEIQRNLYWVGKSLDKLVQFTEEALGFIEPKDQSPFLYNLASFTCPW